MKLAKYSLVAIAALAVLSCSAYANVDRVPDSASTLGLLGCAFAGVAGLRAWLNK